MQRVHCVCLSCGLACRVIVYCLVNGRKRSCEPCERAKDTTWRAPEKWKNARLDERNQDIAKERQRRKEEELAKHRLNSTRQNPNEAGGRDPEKVRPIVTPLGQAE